MGRIRLQVCVLPWELPCSSSSTNAQARREVKWCEPCTEDTPMQLVCDRIYKSWERMFEETMGPLKIRHLKTAYGDFLDLQERVVGDFFDDRGADGNIRNSILEVHRYPPAPDQLDTLQRFSSLAPNSSVRPRKRPLELPSQPYPSPFSRNTHREIPSIEEWDAEATTSFGRESKRQRTHESRLNTPIAARQKSIMREEHAGGPFHSSQTSGTQESVHQVLDSQKSPGKKSLNPYGTPTSLTLVGPQESIPSSEIDLSAIPDSPLGRETTLARAAFAGALQLDRESTKSESPELRASVHEVPPTNPINASGEQPNTSAKSPESSTIICASNSASQPLSGSQNVDQHAKNHGLSVRKTSENVADVNRAPKHRPLKGDLATAQNAQIHSNPLHKSDPIFDPIESDTESFHEKQQMQSAKRLRSSKTPTATFNSLGTSNQEGISRRDGPFVVPAVPQPRTDESRKSLSERTSLGQRKNTPMLRQKPKDVNVSGPNDLKRHGKTLEDAQSEGCNNDRFDVAQETPKRNTVCNDLVDANQTTSRVTTAGLQGSNNTTHGTTEPTVQQRDDSISGQSQEPDNITHLGHNANVVATNPDDSRFAQEAERLAKGAKEQQTKNRVRQKKVEEKEPASEAMERSAANREAVERRTKENVLAGSKGAKEDKAKAKEPMQAKKTNAKEGLVEGKRMQEIRLKEAARERQIKEVSLAEEAHKAMLAADGAKQIEAEEKKKKEKARHEELAAKKQANEAKAVEQARAVQKRDHEKKLREEQRAREKAQKLADAECEDAKGQMPPARTDRETATAVMEQARKRIADREAQRLKGSSEAQSRDSTHPLTSSLVADLRRSMTPRIPGYAVANSSPHLNSLRSSPLSNQSPGNMGAPLRSALRKTPSALRRSVSSVSFHVPPGAKLNEGIASMPNPKSLKENDNQFATKPSAVKDIPTSSPGIASKTPIKTPIPKKISHGKITKTPAKNGKVQTKLNVTRQPKKLKGLAIAPPIKSTQAPKQEIVISSGEDSSTSEEPVWQTGNAEAGPSSRKPTLPAVSRSMKTGQVKSSGARMDPSLRNVKAEKDRTAAPAALPRSKSTSDTTFLPNTTSRSPALPASETISLSSGSASSTASSIASESESESDSKPEPQAPSSKTRTGTESGTRAPVTRAPVPVKGVSKAVNQVAKRPAGHLKSIASSQSSSLVSSSRSRSISIDSTKCDGEHIDQAANKQLQLESRSSVPNARANQTPPTANDAVGDTVINQGLDHDGRLPNGIRPTYYKYPCLSELKKLSRAATPEVEPNLNTSSSQLVGASLGSTENSSSDSDESSSNNSDDHENFDGPLSQVKPKKPFPGMKGLMRLANNAFRSTCGSTPQ